jgi:hypothetical protein
MHPRIGHWCRAVQYTAAVALSHRPRRGTDHVREDDDIDVDIDAEGVDRDIVLLLALLFFPRLVAA